MSTTAQHINAKSDQDLLERFVAAAEILGVPNAVGWVYENLSGLITAQVDGTQKVSDVHAYASEVRASYVAATPPLPGKNLGAVTDAHLTTAIQSLLPAPE